MGHFISLLVGQILAVTFGLFGIQQPYVGNTKNNVSIAIPVPAQEQPLTPSAKISSPSQVLPVRAIPEKKTGAALQPIKKKPAKQLTSPLKKISPIPLTPIVPMTQAPTLAPTEETQLQTTGTLEVTPEIKSISEATMNLVCTQNTAAGTLVVSGTGTVIDPRGVILTNAHVAEHFLASYFSPGIECSVRNVNTGEEYRAQVLFMPSRWVAGHAGDLLKTDEYGTGEDDFSLLIITGRVFQALPLPSSFSFINPEISTRASAGEHVYIAGYPATAGTVSRANPLPLAVEDSVISDTLTFTNGAADVLVVPAESVSDRGSSGGPVVDSSSQSLLGIIVTTAPHEANALALPYLEQEMANETGNGFSSMLAGDVTGTSLRFLSSTGSSLFSALSGQ